MICMPDLSTTDVLYLRLCVHGGNLENNKRCHTLIRFDSYGAPTENVRITTTWPQILDRYLQFIANYLRVLLPAEYKPRAG